MVIKIQKKILRIKLLLNKNIKKNFFLYIFKYLIVNTLFIVFENDCMKTVVFGDC